MEVNRGSNVQEVPTNHNNKQNKGITIKEHSIPQQLPRLEEVSGKGKEKCGEKVRAATQEIVGCTKKKRRIERRNQLTNMR